MRGREREEGRERGRGRGRRRGRECVYVLVRRQLYEWKKKSADILVKSANFANCSEVYA